MLRQPLPILAKCSPATIVCVLGALLSLPAPGVADREGAIADVALVDSGLVSEVRAGENAGARLTHDHVVRALRAGTAMDASGAGIADVVLPWPSEAGHDPAVVAFVQNAQTGDVLQALALPLSEAGCANGR